MQIPCCTDLKEIPPPHRSDNEQSRKQLVIVGIHIDQRAHLPLPGGDNGEHMAEGMSRWRNITRAICRIFNPISRHGNTRPTLPSSRGPSRTNSNALAQILASARHHSCTFAHDATLSCRALLRDWLSPALPLCRSPPQSTKLTIPGRGLRNTQLPNHRTVFY